MSKLRQQSSHFHFYDFDKLKKWFFDLDYQRWDKQLQQDVLEGKLETLAEEAITKAVVSIKLYSDITKI